MHANCLISLGSNLGDREAALRGAIEAIAALANVKLLRQSRLYRTPPVGGPAGQGEFLNAAVLVETAIEPLALLHELQHLENQFGRERGERWAARTLDLDLLLAGDVVIDREELTVPHPRMSFRRFVLEPSAEIAGEMIHPTIGWTIGELFRHLDSAADRLAILSSVHAFRQEVANLIVECYGAEPISAPDSAALSSRWPVASATWLSLPESNSPAESSAAYRRIRTAKEFPKLTIEIVSDPANFSVDHGGAEFFGFPQRGRGPTLRLKAADWGAMEPEVRAAVESVWPDLCRK